MQNMCMHFYQKPSTLLKQYPLPRLPFLMHPLSCRFQGLPLICTSKLLLSKMLRISQNSGNIVKIMFCKLNRMQETGKLLQNKWGHIRFQLIHS